MGEGRGVEKGTRGLLATVLLLGTPVWAAEPAPEADAWQPEVDASQPAAEVSPPAVDASQPEEVAALTPELDAPTPATVEVPKPAKEKKPKPKLEEPLSEGGEGATAGEEEKPGLRVVPFGRVFARVSADERESTRARCPFPPRAWAWPRRCPHLEAEVTADLASKYAAQGRLRARRGWEEAAAPLRRPVQGPLPGARARVLLAASGDASAGWWRTTWRTRTRPGRPAAGADGRGEPQGGLEAEGVRRRLPGHQGRRDRASAPARTPRCGRACVPSRSSPWGRAPTSRRPSRARAPSRWPRTRRCGWAGWRCRASTSTDTLPTGPFAAQLGLASYSLPLGPEGVGVQPVVGAEMLQLLGPLKARGYAFVGGFNVLYSEHFKAQFQAEHALRPGDESSGLRVLAAARHPLLGTETTTMLQFAEGEVTKLRREFKLVLGSGRGAGAVLAAVRGAGRLPAAAHAHHLGLLRQAGLPAGAALAEHAE